MHREARSRAVDSSFLFLLPLLLVFVCPWLGPENLYVAGIELGYSGVCDQLTCRIGEQCVNRKFWCSQPPCPNMTYCAKSRKELLKGPETCESVACPSGYKCLVRVRDCEWNKKCGQRAARCVTDREYEDGPTSCADVVCPSGHHCVLRETHCYQPPCKLTKSCARDRDVRRWFDNCRLLGCPSEHNCFLRRPPSRCAAPPCDHRPDCLDTVYFGEGDSLSRLDRRCQGWICPIGQECSILRDPNCKGINCRLIRSCREAILLPRNVDHDTMQIRAIQRFDEMEMAGGEWPGFKYPSLGTTTKASTSTRVTSLDDSAWLTYLKYKAGADAMQYWTEKAKNNDDYEGFLDWLELVSRLLGPETYQLWLSEVKLLSVDTPELQSWLTLAEEDRSRHTPRWSSPTLPLTSEPARPPIPGFRGDELADSVANSWKSYYRLKGQPGERQPASSPWDYGSTNRTRTGDADDQPRVFFPSQAIGEARRETSRPTRWFQRPFERPTSIRSSGDGDAPDKSQDEFSGVGTLLDSLSGFQQFRDVKPNIFKLSKDDLEEILEGKDVNFTSGPPNFVVYFPPPYNFLIYYSDETLENSGRAARERVRGGIGNPIGKETSNLARRSDTYDSIMNSDKQQRREHIRKFFSELVDYLNDCPRADEKKFPDQSIAKPKTRIHYGNTMSTTNTTTNTTNTKVETWTDDDTPITEFLDWVINNSSLLEPKQRKKVQPDFSATVEEKRTVSESKPTSSETEDESRRGKVKVNNASELPLWPAQFNGSFPKKVRIFVDIDKNPELLEALFSRNKSVNLPNLNEYQVTLNLEDFADPREKNLISRKLIDIVENQARRNSTGDASVPRSVWIFPVYEDSDEKTSGSSKIKYTNGEKRITLWDVDFSTDARSNDGNAEVYNFENDGSVEKLHRQPLRLGPKKSRYSQN